MPDCAREDISADATTTLRRLFSGHQLRNAPQLSGFLENVPHKANRQLEEH
jgi:hypothetical protein